MRKENKDKSRIIALAYFHRYGWIAVMMVCIAIWFNKIGAILSIGSLIFSAWSFVGYKNKWAHIYCSYQNVNHLKMTPDNIQWHKIKKSDAYGIPSVFLILGLLSLIATVCC